MWEASQYHFYFDVQKLCKNDNDNNDNDDNNNDKKRI